MRQHDAASDCGWLIYYERENCSGPKPSNYFISETPDPNSLKIILSSVLGIRGIVRKQRFLYIIGNTRIHLDEVEGLGTFLELEVVLSGGDSLEQGQTIAAELMTTLGIQNTDLREGAYIDLLEPLCVS